MLMGMAENTPEPLPEKRLLPLRQALLAPQRVIQAVLMQLRLLKAVLRIHHP